MAGGGFWVWLQWHLADIEERVSQALIDQDPDYSDLVEEISARTHRLLRALDRGDLYNPPELEWD